MLLAHQYPGLQGYNWRNVLATFVHVHFGSCPALAAQLVERCAAVDVSAVNAAASAAAEAHAGPRSFPLDGSSFNNCNGVHRQRDYKSATVSPESGPGFSGATRPIFPVSVPTPHTAHTLASTEDSQSLHSTFPMGSLTASRWSALWV